MKILIVKLSSLGDVVHAMPAVQDIRRALPDARIDWVVERSFAPLVRRCAGVGRVIECELRHWRQSPLSRETRRAWRSFKAQLQRERYDAVIDLQGLTKSALVAWLALLAPQGQRFGLANQTEGSSFEAPARWLADVAISVPAHVHAVARGRELAARALAYSISDFMCFGLESSGDIAQEAIKNVANTVPPGAPLVTLVHGTSRADKQWPLDHWLTLGRRLNDQGYGVALPHGNEQEHQFAQEMAAGLAAAVVWPRLALDDLTDALAGCAGVIGVDSGLSHVAVALDLPHVQIYNFDTAWRTGPSHNARQCSVFASPTPAVDAVWQAWIGVSGSHAGQAS